MLQLYEIGQICKKMRERKKKTQLQVSIELGYCVENISSFENGRNDNVRIFLWYLNNCIEMSDFEKFVNEVKT